MASLEQFHAFEADDFDVNSYANNVLASDSSQTLGAALNRLNGGIDDLNRQIRAEARLQSSVKGAR
jgi:hypothetical protein